MNDYFFNWQTVSITLIIYGIAFILIERWNKTRTMPITSWDTFSNKSAFQVGLFQILSLIPGTSRSGSTLLGGILLGTDRPIAAEFLILHVISGHAWCEFSKTTRFWL